MILGHRRNGKRDLAAGVVVVGAGPAGLAAASELRRARVPAVVLEQADAVGASWRDRYDRLHLNTARWFSTLPSVAYPRGTGVFPSRGEVASYLADYAQRQALDVRLGVRVERIDREGERWRLRTSTGAMDADHVIVAGGYDHRPYVPAWPGVDEYDGALLHAADYRSAVGFRESDVLVVGPGCSGAEIAYDLAEGGARRVRLAVRTPPNIILRSPIGAPLASAMMRLPTRWADAVLRFVRRRTIGDLTELGLPIPEEGVFSRLRRLHVTPTIVDAAVIEAIRKRRIEIVAAVEALDASGARLADGTRIQPDAVIAATGYGTGLEPVVGHLGVLDARGVPRIVDGEAAPGLRFLGYIARPGPLGHFGEEAQRAAKAIARRSHHPPRPRSRATDIAVNA